MSSIHRSKPNKKIPNILLKILIYLVSFIGPLFTIPQIYVIFIAKSAHDVSILTWSGYLIVAVIWTWYGIVKKDKPIILSNGLWTFAEALVIIGALIYR